MMTGELGESVEHERPLDDHDNNENDIPQAKRQRLDDSVALIEQVKDASTPDDNNASKGDVESCKEEAMVPPSRALLGPLLNNSNDASSAGHTQELDVGISEYISKDLTPIHAIIKQRFTDFLVHEVNLDGEVIHVQSLDMPTSEGKNSSIGVGDALPMISDDPNEAIAAEKVKDVQMSPQDTSGGEVEEPEVAASWSDSFTEALSPHLSELIIGQLRELYLEGPEPPFVSDSGWGSRITKPEGTDNREKEVAGTSRDSKDESTGSKSNTGRGRGQRGGRGRGRGGKRGNVGFERGGFQKHEDTRKVISDPIESKAARTNIHKVVRELFRGKFDTETDTSNPDEEGRIVIRWAHSGQGRDGGQGSRGRGKRSERPARGNYPPYIHFTLQKTNRDNQDALSNLSRTLRCSVKDLSVSGTKDKRGVTVQRVALRRGNKIVEDVWKLANGVPGRRTVEEATSHRGERGVRVADFRYGRAGLDLGMLKGNAFVITLRNVQVDSVETLETAMQSLKRNGFINYYGMQRFGTSSIPTHMIGLAILKCEWEVAISLILRHRPGEHPDVVAARDAWLTEKDLDKALELLPRRVIAERCILESYKKMKGDTRNAFGALSTIPRNLRLMYVHAYQSYVWNAVVSERVRVHGALNPVVGDLVFEQAAARVKIDEDDDGADVEMDGEDDGDVNVSDSFGSKKPKRTWVQPKVKVLTNEDVDKYTIFDVIMPLPGKDVAYPGGVLGERYRKFVKMDGLDPDNFTNKHKDYNLSGSYRKIVLKPVNLSWSVLKYTDPDVPLAQADEDKLLGFEPPVVDENGKFMALQIQMQLITAAYATMALREITKTDTSSHHQTNLTFASEDQAYRKRGVEEEA